MKFTEEHKQLRKTVRDFIDKEINPHCDEWEAKGAFPAHQVFKKAGALGLLGVNKPEAYGGMGLDYSYSLVVAEELGTCAGGSIPMALGVQTDMATPALARWGADELRREFLAPAIAGEMVAAIAVSEVSGGSDVAALKTTAKKDGDDYVINGSKMWITNGGVADWYFVVALTDPEKKARGGMTAFIVERNSPGISVGKKEPNMGQRASDTRAISFEDVEVPAENLVGREGDGWSLAMAAFDYTRPSVASAAVGLSRAAMEYAVQYLSLIHISEPTRPY